jgi:hypothetical protein
MGSIFQSLWACEKVLHFLREYGMILAVVVLALPLLLVLCRRRYVCLSKGKDGSVLLTGSALREMVTAVAEEVGIGGRVGVKVRRTCGRVSLDVHLRPTDWQNLSEVSGVLRERIHEILIGSAGEAAIGKVNVVVTGFMVGKKSMANDRRAAQQPRCGADGDCRSADGGDDRSDGPWRGTI